MISFVYEKLCHFHDFKIQNAFGELCISIKFGFYLKIYYLDEVLEKKSPSIASILNKLKTL